MELDGKVVMISGGSKGLGAALARRFTTEGARVSVCARGEDELQAIAMELVVEGADVFVRSADVTSEEDVTSWVEDTREAFGRVDGFVNNASMLGPRVGIEEYSLTAWRKVIDVNLTGAFLGARAAARVMGAGGRLIFTGSVVGERPRQGLAAYSASKAGLTGLAKALALDLAPAGITVNVVAPGWFDSPLAEGWLRNPELSDAITGHTAQRRWGRTTDLAGAYQFLASDASAFVTGTVLTVDGGYLLV
jgi:NAD(P)-dependent dehydrogenase (short-subunit alcohol dehydrogenase family)